MRLLLSFVDNIYKFRRCTRGHSVLIFVRMYRTHFSLHLMGGHIVDKLIES